MATMSFSMLVAPKSTEGSIKRDVNYEQLDPATIVQEAETLIYDTLRVREMRSVWAPAVSAGDYTKALPTGFLDPMGKLRDSRNFVYTQRAEDVLLRSRVWSQSTGTLGTDPFAVTNGDATVTVTHTAHDLNIGDVVTYEDATAGGGITVDGTYIVATVPTDDTYTIEHNENGTSTDTTTGGSAVAYSYDNLEDGQPCFWTILDELLQFDIRFDEGRGLYLPYYKQPTSIASTNTNFLTDRYPHMLRTATRVRAHTWMKNWTGVQAELGLLTGFIAIANSRADLTYRGADIDQELP